jgi:hypothetical protein
MDKRVPTVYTYIKKPGYYAIFNSGKRAVERQRFGIGIIWTSEAEILLQGQTGTDAEAWGTFDNQLAEAQDLPVNFSIDGETVDPTVGKNDLINGRLQVSYKLANNGNKKVVFKNREISVDIESSGKFREYLPFVLNGDDKMEIQSNKIIIDKNEQTVVVHFPEQFDVQVNTGDLSVYEERQLWPRVKEPKEFRLEVCAISARDNLTYRIEF